MKWNFLSFQEAGASYNSHLIAHEFYLHGIVLLKVGSGNCGTDFDQSLGDKGSSALLSSSTIFPEVELILSGAIDCSLALLAQ